MFDLNAIVSAALNAAVEARITEVLAQHANIVGGLAERVAALEKNEEYLTNRIAVLENSPAIGVLEQRITALERDISHTVQVQQANIVAALAERIAALESDLARAVSVVEQRTERITALETKLTEAALFTQMTPATITADAFVTHLDNQEWFWEKLQNRIDSTVEAGLDDHCSNYDHDSYDAVVSDSDDYAKSDDLEDFVRDAVSNLTFEVSVS